MLATIPSTMQSPRPAQLQLALDHSLEDGLAILSTLSQHIDIIEVGTRLIIHHGVQAVSTTKKAYPKHTVLADVKIMDAGEDSADLAFAAGADIVTVLGCASDSTIAGVVASAKKHNAHVMADLIQVSDLNERSAQLLALGVDYLCVHTAFDAQATTSSPCQHLATLHKTFPEAQLAIAGGLSLEKLAEVIPYNPAIVVVGGAITKADDPEAAANAIQARLAKR